MKQIEFTRPGSNTILGNFAPGDVARCSDALARHLVDEIKVAKYPQAAREAPPAAIKHVRRRRVGK